jgi:hypothetical protein
MFLFLMEGACNAMRRHQQAGRAERLREDYRAMRGAHVHATLKISGKTQAGKRMRDSKRKFFSV